ncbi:S8 family serine peptidase [Actinoplanes sp. KI2]|uniref:S8 family serine peptidase n=1 Tax=Actinoplanes sp. KI2 TaxID=2983315 RepID=UPI0021D572A3|nr:S8 family serine peptidase [Actinoplanes sp. KI2]MCU7725446.1 S8 family serine peptidase [Actinoplanes sp. KI2]
MVLTRTMMRAAIAAVLPLSLAGVGTVVTAAPAAASGSNRPGGWQNSATGTTGPTSLKDVRSIIGADTGVASLLTGAGVGVALLDTGVVPVSGLPAKQIVNGPDLSFESQADGLRYLDSYGHGTHMAGIIVGNDTASGSKGLAPGAKLTSVKLGTANGAVDVSQVIAAIDWVVANKDADPANPIRVINLSYGSGGNPSSTTDPLQFAVEQAWKAGIVVVAAAGNDGAAAGTLDDPATDPFVLSVGAADTNGTVSTADDEVAEFSSSGSAARPVDVLAPGESIISLRDPGSSIDVDYPAARVGDTLFRGSGTSQATAITSAAVALLLQARPWLTPDQVKNLLKRGTSLTGSRTTELNVGKALGLIADPSSTQKFRASTGNGKLDDARGDSRVLSNNIPLSGENSVWGPFRSANWAAFAAQKRSWVRGTWMGSTIAGTGWTGASWASKTWGAAAWAGGPWGGTPTWSDPSWSIRRWSSARWSTTDWSGARYTAGVDWATSTWG